MLEMDKLNEFTASHGELQRGKGRVTGTIALSLGILCFLGVLAFHFPQYLTTPELRRSYNVDIMRTILLVAMVV
ncbi:fatty acid hydroxylase, partial [Halomonas sp. ND22Bw]